MAQTDRIDRVMEDTEDLIEFFGYTHLPENLQAVSRPFGDLAAWSVVNLPRNRERTKALDRLLEAKDAAVRAAKLGTRGAA